MAKGFITRRGGSTAGAVKVFTATANATPFDMIRVKQITAPELIGCRGFVATISRDDSVVTGNSNNTIASYAYVDGKISVTYMEYSWSEGTNDKYEWLYIRSAEDVGAFDNETGTITLPDDPDLYFRVGKYAFVAYF